MTRKLHNIANSGAVKRRCIVLDTILRIHTLKLKLEAIEREYNHLLNNIKEVKVEKFGENFLANITCKNGGNVLVSILETFEAMGLNVAQAKVSCTGSFLRIEAIVQGRNQTGIDAQCIQETVYRAIDKQGG